MNTKFAITRLAQEISASTVGAVTLNSASACRTTIGLHGMD